MKYIIIYTSITPFLRTTTSTLQIKTFKYILLYLTSEINIKKLKDKKKQHER